MTCPSASGAQERSHATAVVPAPLLIVELPAEDEAPDAVERVSPEAFSGPEQPAAAADAGVAVAASVVRWRVGGWFWPKWWDEVGLRVGDPALWHGWAPLGRSLACG